jgi:hypothetical protein
MFFLLDGKHCQPGWAGDTRVQRLHARLADVVWHRHWRPLKLLGATSHETERNTAEEQIDEHHDRALRCLIFKQ